MNELLLIILENTMIFAIIWGIIWVILLQAIDLNKKRR